MVTTYLLSGIWSAGLAVVQLKPREAANWLMGTKDLDAGDFWTLSPAENSVAIPAAVLLMTFAIGYISLAARMLVLAHHRSQDVVPRHGSSQSGPPRRGVRSSSPSLIQQIVSTPASVWNWRWLHRRATQLVTALDNPIITLPKLLLQTTILFRYLHDGFPLVTIFTYVSLLLVNWIISTYCSIYHLTDARSTVVRLFDSFDLFFAVLAPMQMLINAYIHFKFDFAEFATRVVILNPGNFDRIARLFADPVQVSVFRTAFTSLQFATTMQLAVKTALNALAIRRLWFSLSLPRPGRQSVSLWATPSRKWRRRQAALFFFGGIVLFIYTVVAVVSSVKVCALYTHCKVPSYRWNVGARICSCTVFVDRKTTVATLSEWENPVDTIDNLAGLAAAGDLKVVQIVNRRLETLPIELRNCRWLEQLILIYTKTVSIPEWAREFTNLEYIHIEGDLTSTKLVQLPPDMFSRMSHLAFLHLGCLAKLEALPDLSALGNLRYLFVALLYSIKVLPRLDNVTNLRSLGIVDLTNVKIIPSVRALHKLESIAVVGRNPFCCNGFISGVCDPTRLACRNPSDTRSDCTPNRIPAADLAILKAADNDFCTDKLVYDLTRLYPSHTATDMCSGVKYKRCELFGAVGICFPSRYMAISCDTSGMYTDLRRLQIKRRVGDQCDPVVEDWLGCQ